MHLDFFHYVEYLLYNDIVLQMVVTESFAFIYFLWKEKFQVGMLIVLEKTKNVTSNLNLGHYRKPPLFYVGIEICIANQPLNICQGNTFGLSDVLEYSSLNNCQCFSSRSGL